MKPTTWLIVFSEVEGLRWVLTNSRMAFSKGRCLRASSLRPGDELILYVGRGAYHNPTRDRSQIVGWADVKSEVTALDSPVVIRGRKFVCGCKLILRNVLSERDGMPFEPLVPKLDFIQRKEVWGMYLRSGLVTLTHEDASTLRHAFGEFTRSRHASNP